MVFSLFGALLQVGNQPYELRYWSTVDGLPHISVNHIAQDTDGYMWLATLGGLIRFDGMEFQEMKIPGEFRTRGFNIRSLVADPEGGLLFQTTSGKVLQYQSRELFEHPVSFSLGASDFADLFLAQDGALWLGVGGKSLIRWWDSSSQVFNFQQDINVPISEQVAQYACDHEHRLWVSFSGFFGYYQNGKLTPVDLGIGDICLLVQADPGSFYLGTKTGLYLYEQGNVSVLSEDVPWVDNPEQLRHGVIDVESNLWIAGGVYGLLLWSGSELHELQTRFNQVNYVTEDTEGHIWVSSEGNGVAMICRRDYRVFDVSSGLKYNVYAACDFGEDGSVWLLGSSGDLEQIYEDKVVRHFQLGKGSDLRFNNLCVDGNGGFWFGTSDGVFRMQLPSEKLIDLNVGSFDISTVYNDHRGDIWFSSESGESGYIRENTVHDLSDFALLAGRTIQAISEDRDGAIWGSTLYGDLFSYRNGIDELFDVNQPVPDLYVDSEGILWIATIDGLYVKHGSQLRRITTEQGLADDRLSQIVEDVHENLWFSSSSGLFYVSRQSLLDFVNDKKSRIDSHYFGKEQGLTGISFLSQFVPSDQVDKLGRLWFSTSTGLIAINPDAALSPPPHPKVHLDAIRFDGREIRHLEKAIEIPPGGKGFEVYFSVPCFSDARNLTVEYKLQGVDREWVSAGLSRMIRYPSVSPGSYQFKVRASSGNGEKSANEAALQIRVLPTWWQTIWFRIFLLVVVATVLAVIVRDLSQRRLRKRLVALEQERLLEKERSRIARDLHDDLGGKLVGLQMLSSRLLRNQKAEKDSDLQLLSDRIRRLNTDVRSIIWQITPKNSTLHHLADYVGKFARDYFKEGFVSCVVSDPHEIPEIPIRSNVLHHLFSTIKESITNVVKHASATKVKIEFAFEHGEFTCSVSDNGRGFVPESVKSIHGNGLRNMRTRMSEIGAKIEVNSKPNEGTSIRIRYRVRPLK